MGSPVNGPVIGRRELMDFQRIDELRNALAHGVAGRRPTRDDFDRLVNFAKLVLDLLSNKNS